LPAASGKTDRPQRRRNPPKSARLIVDEDRVVPLSPQPGWRFKGFKVYTVQDLVIETRVVRYWRPCYRRAGWSSRRCRPRSPVTSGPTWCAIC
jgi:hypothetical protein